MAKWRGTSCASIYEDEKGEERAIEELHDDWVCPGNEAFVRRA